MFLTWLHFQTSWNKTMTVYFSFHDQVYKAIVIACKENLICIILLWEEAVAMFQIQGTHFRIEPPWCCHKARAPFHPIKKKNNLEKKKMAGDLLGAFPILWHGHLLVKFYIIIFHISKSAFCLMCYLHFIHFPLAIKSSSRQFGLLFHWVKILIPRDKAFKEVKPNFHFLHQNGWQNPRD